MWHSKSMLLLQLLSALFPAPRSGRSQGRIHLRFVIASKRSREEIGVSKTRELGDPDHPTSLQILTTGNYERLTRKQEGRHEKVSFRMLRRQDPRRRHISGKTMMGGLGAVSLCCKTKLYYDDGL